MSTWLKKLRVMAAAVAFAEEGEWQTAAEILRTVNKRPARRDSERKSQPRTRPREHSYRV